MGVAPSHIVKGDYTKMQKKKKISTIFAIDHHSSMHRFVSMPSSLLSLTLDKFPDISVPKFSQLLKDVLFKDLPTAKHQD